MSHVKCHIFCSSIFFDKVVMLVDGRSVINRVTLFKKCIFYTRLYQFGGQINKNKPQPNWLRPSANCFFLLLQMIFSPFKSFIGPKSSESTMLQPFPVHWRNPLENFPTWLYIPQKLTWLPKNLHQLAYT